MTQSEKTFAPIVLFVYNRPHHTKKTINALRRNSLAKYSDLIVFSDGPKNNSNSLEVAEVRAYLKTVTGFKSIQVREMSKNQGLEKSIILGVTAVLKTNKCAIIVEDDLVTHPQFLEFMNEGLHKYKNSKNVYSITGYSYFRNRNHSEDEVTNYGFFLNLTSTWTWATWADKWKYFDDVIEDAQILHSNLKLRREFNFDNSYPFEQMLRKKANGKVKSWGIIWYWSVFKRGGLTLFPTHTLVDQIGFDGSGENSRNYVIAIKNIVLCQYKFIYPSVIQESIEFRNKVAIRFKYRKLFVLIENVKYFVTLVKKSISNLF